MATWIYRAVVVWMLLYIIFMVDTRLTPAPDPRFVALADSYARLQQETELKIKDVTNKINACIDHPNFRDCVRNYGIKINQGERGCK